MANENNAIRRMFDAVSLGAPENAVGFVLWRIVARYQREVDRSLARLDLTNLQFVTLALAAWLRSAGEPANQAELARFGGIQPMQLSHMLKTLEAKGFVSREWDRADSRSKRIGVTPSGLKVLRQALPRVIEVQSRLFGEEGRPGGRLLQTLLDLERRLDQATEE